MQRRRALPRATPRTRGDRAWLGLAAQTAAPVPGADRRADRARLLDDRSCGRRSARGRQRGCRAPGEHQAACRRPAAARQEPQIPGRGDPDCPQRQPHRRQNRCAADGHVPPGDRRSRHLVPGQRALPAVEQPGRAQNNFIFASKACEAEGGWLPTAAQLLGGANRVQPGVDDPRFPADGDRATGPQPRTARSARDELDADHHRPPAPPPRARRASAKAQPATRDRARQTRPRCPPTRCRRRSST